MSRDLAALFSDLESHSLQWSRTSNERMVPVLTEYRNLAESMASQYGCLHRNFTGDGHLFLFEHPDAAVQFGLRLIQAWRRGASVIVADDMAAMPMRLGAHYGECEQLEKEAWIGRGINLAKRVEAAGATDCVTVTETMLEVMDRLLYTFEEAGSRALKGDQAPTRMLYRVTAFDSKALLTRPSREMTAEAWFLRGTALVGTAAENGPEEVECYQKAIELKPDYPEAHNNLAILKRAAGDAAGAAQHYRLALEQRPDYPEAHYNYAILLEMRGGTAGAAEHYREALRLSPDYADAHHAYANLVKRKGDHALAQGHYESALRIRPAYPEALSNYAILLEDLGRFDEAECHYRRAIELQPTYKEAYYNLALLLENLGRPDEARRHYEVAIGLWPEYPEAHNNLAALLHAVGDLDAAAKHYQIALKFRPNDPEAHHNYALLLLASGNAGAAGRHFRTARELAPDSPDFTSSLETPG